MPDILAEIDNAILDHHRLFLKEKVEFLIDSAAPDLQDRGCECEQGCMDAFFFTDDDFTYVPSPMSDNDREALDYMIETLGPNHPYSHPYWAVSTLAELRTYLDSRRNELTKVPRLKINRTPSNYEKEGEAAPRSNAQTLEGV